VFTLIYIHYTNVLHVRITRVPDERLYILKTFQIPLITFIHDHVLTFTVKKSVTKRCMHLWELPTGKQWTTFGSLSLNNNIR